MKKFIILLFTLSLILNLCACSLSGKIPSLEEIVENGAEWGIEQLQQAQGCTLADLEKAWGTADGELSGMYGYFWKVGDTVSVNVNYYKNGELEHISVSDWKDGNNANDVDAKEHYAYEELSEMPAEELLDLFIQNGLVINDDLKASYTEEELQTLFKEHFDMWHIGLSALSHTMYLDLAEQTKAIYDAILGKYIALDSDMVPIVNIPDKGTPPLEYPDTIIVPGFDLDEPDEPDTP